MAEELPYCVAGGEKIYGEWSHHASSMGMAVATMVLGGKTFEREVAGVLFDSIGEALVSTKSIAPGSKERLIKQNPLARSSRRHANGSVGRTVAMPARGTRCGLCNCG